MADFEKNRRLLYNKIPKEYKKYKGVDLTLDQFNKIWYKDENIFSEGNINLFKYLNDNVDNMFVRQDTVRTALKSKRSFYRTFACDLEWAKKYTFCGGEESEVNFGAYVGEYFSKLAKKIRIYTLKDENDVDVLYLSSVYLDQIPKLSELLGKAQIFILSPTDVDGKFTISDDQGVSIPKLNIIFKSDGFSINGEVLNRNVELLKANKVTTKDDDGSSSPDDDKDKPDSATNTTKPDDKKSDIPVVKSKPLYFNNDQKDTTPKKSCDDFPFTLGCVNTKIGDLNAKFFRGNRYDDMYNKQLENVLDNNGYFSNSKNELTKDVWDYLMNKSIMKESIKKVLKEYINKKK